MLITILFELTRFVKLQNVVKIKFILIQARGKLITGLFFFFFNLQVDGISLYPDLTLRLHLRILPTHYFSLDFNYSFPDFTITFSIVLSKL